jgi:NADPH:quinone reductase-like Zn-dependent oxidoreductase
MKAIACTQYGPPDVLQFQERETPTPPDNEVLIRIHAASVNPVDLHLMRGKPFFLRLMSGGLLAPERKVPGHDIAGRVEAIGRNVTQCKPGDEVFGACRGAFAEYACALENNLAQKPANISFEDAAAVPIAALTALQGLRDKGHIQPGQKVLVDGASGGVGTFAIQIAKSFGAEVTAVCSTRKMDTARSVGAGHVIDYTRENFTKSGQRYDLILAANAHHSISDYSRALSPNGIFVMAGGGAVQALQVALLGPLVSRIVRKQMGFFIVKVNQKDLAFLKTLLETGKVTPVIDRRYPLSEAGEALRYLAKGHAQGKIVLTVDHTRDDT